MTETVRIAVPRKGRPLEAVLERLAAVTDGHGIVDEVASTLRYEKAIAKGLQKASGTVYERLKEYSDITEPTAPEYTLLRDDRRGMPRRIVFDSATVRAGELSIELIGREEPFRALRTHEFALGFDSADLVLEEVVELRPEGLGAIADINTRINPRDTDVRVVTSLGDTVYHTLLATPEVLPPGADLDRSFLNAYQGPVCISPRFERLVEAVLGTETTDGIEFVYPPEDVEEEAAIAGTGVGVYLTMTGATARDHGLVLGTDLFPSETVLMQNNAEVDESDERLAELLAAVETETAIRA
jgi:hypothetical protein